MKQMTEEQLREMLIKAYEQGGNDTLDDERGVTCKLLDQTDWDKRRDDFIDPIIQSL